MDISNLSFGELKSLHVEVGAAIKAQESDAIAEARRRISEIADSVRMAPHELVSVLKLGGDGKIAYGGKNLTF